MSPGKIMPWLAAVVAVIAVVVVVRFSGTHEEQSQPTAPTAVEQALPTAVPYEFVWPDGAVRGIDVPDKLYIKSIGKYLPVTLVGDLRSQPGEDLVAFLQRVRREMVAYSDRQTFEACALICSDGDSEYSVRMTTVGGVANCAVAPICMEDHVSLRQTIHSHCPKRPGLRATMTDEFLSGGTMRRRRHFGLCDPDGFSSTDYAGWRPGWLAGVEALYRQDGPSHITTYK